jgi:hypothetical protein
MGPSTVVVAAFTVVVLLVLVLVYEIGCISLLEKVAVLHPRPRCTISVAPTS